MIIRNMEKRDLEQVSNIENSTFTRPWTYQDFESAIDDSNNLYQKLYLVAEEEGNILGYCGLWGIAGEGQINNVAVKESCRNKHVGLTMLKELIYRGFQNDLNAFTLEVRVSNQSAIKLYQNLGFVNVGIRKNFYDFPNEDAIIMWLRCDE